MKKIAILGAGISGLSLAWFLQKQYGQNLDITIFEAAGHAGGWVKSLQQKDALFECGPRSLRAAGRDSALFTLISDLGLESSLVFPQKKLARYVAKGGKLNKVPQSLFAGKLLIKALLHDLFAKRGEMGDESVASFFERRCGRQFVEELVDPLITGIYAATSDAISIQSAFPSLIALEQKYRSLFIGALFQKKPKASLFSLKEGIGVLPSRLASELSCSIHFDTPVKALYDTNNKAYVVTASATHEFDCVVSTLPAHAVGHILQEGDSLKPIFDSLKMTSLTTVSFGYHNKQPLPDGFGFLCNPREGKGLLGVVFDSNLFLEHNGSYPSRLSVMMDASCTKEEATFFIQKYLNILDTPDFIHIEQIKNGICRYEIGHMKKVREIEKDTKTRRLQFIGASLYGPSVGDSIEAAFAFTKKQTNF